MLNKFNHSFLSKKLNYVFTTIIFLVGTSNVIAQTVSGIVFDNQVSEAIIGATVMVKNSDKGTITDIDGKYSVDVTSLNDTLIFSFI